MDASALQRWAQHLRATAGGDASDVDAHRAGAVGRPFELAIGDQSCAAPQPTPVGEVGLWWAIVDESIDVDTLIAQPTDGSLLHRDMYRAIEVWTEADLCGLHALWRLARQRDRNDWQQRCEQVRRWHLEHTQPDNATNRPWALHVFLLAGDDDGRMYAETLLHNAMAMTGEPEPLSAAILRDAARELEVAAR